MSKSGWIYCLRGPDNLVKIGKSQRKPTQRVAEYSPLLPFETEIEIEFQANDMNAAEEILHGWFKNFHARGEWYKIPSQTLSLWIAVLSNNQVAL